LHLSARVSPFTHKIGRKPMAKATAEAPAMVGAVRRSLVAADELLPVIIAESAGYARRKPDVVHRAKRIIQLPLEAPIHASDQTEASEPGSDPTGESDPPNAANTASRR
jgi:hypothetical protein